MTSGQVLREKPSWSETFKRLCLVGLLVGLLLTLGAGAAAFVLLRVVVPIVGGMAGGLASGIAGAVAEVPNILTHGDSQQRLAILTEIKRAIDNSALPLEDPQLGAWLTQPLEACRTDSNPEVVALADGILLAISQAAPKPSR